MAHEQRAKQGGFMDCPVCGCQVAEPDVDLFVLECACCGAIWLVAPDHRSLDHVLVGAEG